MKIFKTDTHLLLVDKTAEIKEGDFVQENGKPVVKCIKDLTSDIVWESLDGKSMACDSKECFVKIIASYPKLGDLPEFETLPPTEDDVEKLANEFRQIGSIIKHPDPHTNVFESGIYQGFIVGYKQAMKKYKK